MLTINLFLYILVTVRFTLTYLHNWKIYYSFYLSKSIVKCQYVNSFEYDSIFFIDFISWWIILIHITKALIKSHVLNFIRLKVSLCILRKRDVLVRKKNVSSSIIIRIRLRHNLTSVTYLKPKKLNPSKAWSVQRVKEDYSTLVPCYKIWSNYLSN